MNNITKFSNCYGCGICAKICPVDIIDLLLDEEGFYKPSIGEIDKCLDCGLCLKVCSYADHALINTLEPESLVSYSAFSKDPQVLSTCSSGGIAYEIGRYLLTQNYKAIGVNYNVQLCRAEHIICDNIDDLNKTKGSKYLQSYTVNALVDIQKNDRYVVFGTPCFIDSFRRYVKLKNLEKQYVLIDFFCHGVPSYMLWSSYLSFQKQKESISNIQSVVFRSKLEGWHSWTMVLNTPDKSIVSSTNNKDPFYLMFLSDTCLNRACYDKCKFKLLSSSADIRVGDLWSTKYSSNNSGVSGVVCYTSLGKNILKNLKETCCITEEDISIVSESQMSKSPNIPKRRDTYLNLLNGDNNLPKVYSKELSYQTYQNIKSLPLRIVRKCLRILKI